MKYYETKIGKIIEQEFDTIVESVVFIYIMDKGIERIKRITDEDIAGIEGDGLCTAAFNQNLVKCARHICTECEWIEIIEYIRLFLFCTPTVHEVSLYREDFSKDSFANENYYESWRFVPVLSLSSVFMAISGMAGSNFSATKESKYFFYSSVWGALAAVIANIIFIPRIGTMGACLSVALSFLVMSLSRCFYCWRHVKINNILRIMLSLAGNIIIIMLTLSSLYISFKIVGYCLFFIFILYVNGDVLKQVFNVIKTKI